jgi:hypothetical protein
MREELDLIELGGWFDYLRDEPSQIEHRLCAANGLTYGCPPRHWRWRDGGVS